MTLHFTHFLAQARKKSWGGFFLVDVAGEGLSQGRVCCRGGFVAGRVCRREGLSGVGLSVYPEKRKNKHTQVVFYT